MPHIGAIPPCATYRAIIVPYSIKASTTEFCDTVAASIARSEKLGLLGRLRMTHNIVHDLEEKELSKLRFMMFSTCKLLDPKVCGFQTVLEISDEAEVK